MRSLAMDGETSDCHARLRATVINSDLLSTSSDSIRGCKLRLAALSYPKGIQQNVSELSKCSSSHGHHNNTILSKIPCQKWSQMTHEYVEGEGTTEGVMSNVDIALILEEKANEARL